MRPPSVEGIKETFQKPAASPPSTHAEVLASPMSSSQMAWLSRLHPVLNPSSCSWLTLLGCELHCAHLHLWGCQVTICL